MNAYDDVWGAAQGLPPTDRIRLIHALWDTVPPGEWPLPSDEWITEAQRRSAECEAGRMTASTWQEVRVRARRTAGFGE